MEIILNLIDKFGIVIIPILLVSLVVYQLFQILKERDHKMEIIVGSFNKTIQDHLSGNSVMVDQMIKSFEVWREISTKEHANLLQKQDKIMIKLKVK